MSEPKTETTLYELVKNYLQKEFSRFGECKIEITNKKITEKQNLG